MRGFVTPLVGVLLAWVASDGADAQDVAPVRQPLAVGETVTVSLHPDTDGIVPDLLGSARVFRIVPDNDGPLTLDVTSVDDVVAARIDEDLVFLELDDDGGVEWNARLVLEASAGEPLLVLAGCKGNTATEVVVTLGDDDVPLPEGVELAKARAECLRGRGAAMLARGRQLDAAIALHQAGQLDLALGQHVACRRAYTTVRELAEELDHALLHTLALAHLGAVHKRLNELDEARVVLEQAVAEARALPHDVIEMFALSYLGPVLRDLGELASARRELGRALELTRTLGDRANEIAVCSDLGYLEWLSGDPRAADEWNDRAVALAREVGDPVRLVNALLDAGRIQERVFRFAEARVLYAEALEVASTPYQQARALGHLGTIAMHTGHDVEALDLYDQALVSARRLGDVGLEAAALTNLGWLHHRLGDDLVAHRTLEEALALLGEGAPIKRAKTLRILAIVRIDLGRPEAARQPLDEALALAEQSGNARLQGLVYSTQVDLHYHNQDYALGLVPAQRQLALGREHGLPDIEAIGLDNLGELHLRVGNLDAALEHAEQAVQLIRELGDRRYLQAGLLTLVEIAHRRRDVEAMAAIIREAESCFDSIDMARLDPDRASLLRATEVFFKWGEWSQDLVANALADDPSPEEAARIVEEGFLRAGQWKGRSLLLGIAEHRRGTRNAATIEVRRERQDVMAELEGVLIELATRLREQTRDASIDMLQARVDTLQDRVAELLAEERRLRPADAALDAPAGIVPADLADVLGQQDVLIEYVDGSEQLYAYVLHEGRLSFHELGTRAGIDDRVATFRDGISDPASLATAAEVARTGRQLYEELLLPLPPAEQPDRARLLIVPTATLAALSFEALVVAAPDRPTRFEQLTFVIDAHEVGYAPSTPVLALLHAVGPRSGPGSALIFADPVYGVESRGDAQPRHPGPVPSTWARLPGTRAEALAVAKLLSREEQHEELTRRFNIQRSLREENPAYRLYVGSEARLARLAGNLRDYAVIHCASHGWLDPDDPRRSGLLLTRTDGDDGILTIMDILDLDMDADLAVLSACETGRGEDRRGEGVQSMARAFMYAGARSVVASLWQVDDRETVEVMRGMYAAIVRDGAAPSAALHAARLGVRRAGSGPEAFRGTGRGRPVGGDTHSGPHTDLAGHPYFWASFVYVGLPR